MTDDDKRHGATTLLAALDVLTGAVIVIDREVPRGLETHMILDNYPPTVTPPWRPG